MNGATSDETSGETPADARPVARPVAAGPPAAAAPPVAAAPWPLLWGVVAGCGMFLLLGRLVFEGWAHSFDSAIYARSLWGMAHGSMHNPVVDLHVLSVHANFLLFVLAPLARVVEPALLLVVAQAVAYAFTVAIVARAFVDAAPRWPAALMALAGTATVVAAPIVTNPFLFDVRPDLWAVPMLTWGLLRAHRRGSFDGAAVAAMATALLIREEAMMVIVGAMVLCPAGRPWRDQLGLRVAFAAGAVGWWALYWFGFRQWVGDGSFAVAQEVSGSFLDGATMSLRERAGYKAEIVVAAAATGGGLALLGWRWFGAAVPGLLFLLVSSRLQELVLSFHYALFAAPGVLVAAASGLAALHARALPAPRRLLAVAATVVVALGVFRASNALPGGGRYALGNFFVGGGRGTQAQLAQLASAYAVLEQVPAQGGLAAPHEMLAPYADREVVIQYAVFVRGVAAGQARDDVAWVAVPRRDWATRGRALVERHGFRLTGRLSAQLALLSRAAAAPPPALEVAAGPCAGAIATWRSAGLTLCAASRQPDGHVEVTVQRTREVAGGGPWVVAALAGGTAHPALAVEGLLPASQLPLGAAATFVTAAPIEAGPLELALTDAEGRPLPAWVGDASEPRATVRVGGN